MDEIKRKNFFAAHPGLALPEVEPITPQRTGELKEQLAARLRVPSDDGLQMVRALSGRSVPVKGIDASGHGFDLTRVLWRQRIAANEHVYLNWYRFDKIDRVRLSTFAQYFTDFWYPSSDDLDVFDESCDWVASISHAGVVSIARL